MKSIRTFLTFALLIIFSSIGVAAPVDINSADAAALAEALTGVGDKTAKAIVDYRKQHGPFQSVQDLLKVRGIGPKLLEKNKQDISVSN